MEPEKVPDTFSPFCRFGIHWPEIDEGIELASLLLGAKAPGATPPVEA